MKNEYTILKINRIVNDLAELKKEVKVISTKINNLIINLALFKEELKRE